jgi:hypothetical protein
MTKETNAAKAQEAAPQEQEVNTGLAVATDVVEGEAIEHFDSAQISDGESLSAMLAASRSLNAAKPVLTLTNVYKEFDKIGETFRGVYYGISNITVKDQATQELVERPAVRLINEGTVYLNAGVNLVNQFRRNNLPVGTAVQIEYIEKQGNVKVYSLAILG